MGGVLRDGTVIPSHMSASNTAFGEPAETFHNWGLRHGEILEKIPPSDARSVTGKFWEYKVLVQYLDRRGRATSATYPNCTVSSLFGGKADRTWQTYRTRDKDPNGTAPDDTGLGRGSKVTLLCVGGVTGQAIIVGGFRDKDDSDDESLGHNFHWEFNGIVATVDNDGELKVQLNGANNSDGSLRSDIQQSNVGGSFAMAKDGTATLSLPHKVSISAPDQATVTSGKIDLGGGSTQALVLGTTYRSNEGTMNSQVSAALDQVLGGLNAAVEAVSQAAAALASAAASMIVPVAGAVIAAGPIGAASESLIQAAAALGVVIGGVTQQQAAIQAFEAQASQYLSGQNTTL